ncbi:MAG: sulfatase-like hydrolase/transferase, partial [Firmicutes bacterium]|nr:sulfatase-like hydrolase/transferase [Bacillota bacterium]
QSDESKSSETEALLTPKKKNDIMSILYFLFIPVSLLFMELLVKFLISGSIFDRYFIYILLFSLSYGCLLSAICGAFRGIGRRTLTKITLFLLGAFFSFHLGYYKSFICYFNFDNMKEAENVIKDFSSLILDAALNVWYAILIMMLPLVIFCIFGKKFAPKGKNDIVCAIISAVCAVVFYASALGLITSTGTVYVSDGYTYKYARSDIAVTYNSFGMITASRLDIKQAMFGEPEEELFIPNFTQVKNNISPSDKEYGYNILDIDFELLAKNETDKTIKSMHEYVAAQQPTTKNEYTGMFEGKNLIMLTLEAFSDKIIDPEFTPTLYKMTQEGFQFNNYYHSSWGGSTASGEYTNLTGNIYNSSTCLRLITPTNQPLTMAKQLAKKGYVCYAYHDHDYQYYSRHISHPNLGYIYKAVGNGLDIGKITWPESDLKMAQASIDDYIDQQPFHTYYMSVSGHKAYTFEGNYMACEHRKDLPEKYKNYPSNLKAYLACQYEVELMLEYLVERLDEAGILDDTVFVMTADHYPYGLPDEDLSLLYGLPQNGIRRNNNLFRNSLIIWSSSMESPITVDKVCCSNDILPTMLNLWGIDYDSRLLIGKDIFSNSEGLAYIRLYRYNWVTNEGEYYYSTERFIPSESCTMTDEEIKKYISQINQIVKSNTDFSKQVLDKNYYDYVPGI